MRFAYARTGGPLLDWSGPTPPTQSRAGETRSLGDWSATTRNSAAVRRFGGRLAPPNGAAIGYEVNRQLGALPSWMQRRGSAQLTRAIQRSGRARAVALKSGTCASGCWPEGGSCYCPQSPSITRAFGSLDLPRPGAPEVVEGYESPQPGAATIHLGGYMPEGAARAYGQTMLSATPAPSIDYGTYARRAAVLAAAYHGVKRHNGSVLWGLLWGLAAYVAPFRGLPVVAIGVAQGFAQAKGPTQNPAGSRTKRRRARIAARRRRQGYYKTANVKARKRRRARGIRARIKAWG